MARPITQAPGPRPLPLLGRALDLLRTPPWELVYQLGREHGELLTFTVLTKRFVALEDPALVRAVVEDTQTFEKGIPNPAVQPIVGSSIFGGNRPTWTFGREHHPYARDYAVKAFAGMVPSMLLPLSHCPPWRRCRSRWDTSLARK